MAGRSTAAATTGGAIQHQRAGATAEVTTAGRRPALAAGLISLALMAIAVPALLAKNWSPSATYLNQAASLVGWGALLIALFSQFSAPLRLGAAWGGRAALAALGLMGLAALASPFWAGLPSALSLSSLGLIAAAALVLLGAMAAVRQSAGAEDAPLGVLVFQAFCVGLVVAGGLSLLVALVQYFAPEWTDGNWLARPSSPARVGANLRQPNHLSSLLLWAMVALVWLHERHGEPRAAAHREGRGEGQAGVTVWRAATALLMAALALGLVLTVSRTGSVCVLLMAVWGIVDRRLSRFARVMLWVLPLVYVAWWLGVDEWSRLHAHAFAGESQLNKSDLSSSRFGIWSNTLSLIAAHPWAGVGWGEFNFAWSLTAFPGRPVAFFDHTHNLPLQLMVEMGVPLALLVMGLLLWALWCATRACWRAPLALQPMARAALLMVLMMVVHSQLEYPLWYAYFLLPTAFALGIGLGLPSAKANVPSPGATRVNRGLPFQVLLVGAWLLTTGGVLAVLDYVPVVHVFDPPARAVPLEQRIVRGQQSFFSAHHADYADVTTAPYPSMKMLALSRATHFLLDTRLMMAWARAYAERGDVERARYLADRLREFRNPASDEFFALCASPVLQGDARPFQCTPASAPLGFKDFR